MQKIAVNSFFDSLDQITNNLNVNNLADVFRFISFHALERYEKHRHKRIEINYVKKGSCIIQLDNESISFRKNELMIICTDVPHSFEAGTNGCTLMQLEFLPDMFSNVSVGEGSENRNIVPLEMFATENRLIKIVDNVHIVRSVERIVSEMNAKTIYFQHLIIMYYTELLILIYRYMNNSYLSTHSSELLKTAVESIRDNYASEISIGQLASTIGVSDGYLRRLFARHLNLSPVDYCNQIRVNKSIELIRSTDLSIKEICFRCGFKSPQYFSRVFKRQVGVSPRDMFKK